MLYLIHGTDRAKVIAEARRLIGELRKRRPDAELFTVSADGLNPARLRELALEQGLFEAKHIVSVKDAFSRKDTMEELVALLPELAASPNVFIFSESSVLKPVGDAFATHAQKVFAFDAPKKEKPNVFALANALAVRDRQKLWVEYTKALRRGAVPEELSGMLFWKVKEMLGGERTGRFSTEELRVIARKLITMYHEAHRGKIDFEVGLEQFILSL